MPVQLSHRRDLGVTRTHAVVTGGTGFLMVHLINEWLHATPQGHVTVLGRTRPEEAVLNYLGGRADRVHFICGDVRRPETWAAEVANPVDLVIHGAALCPMTEAEEAALWAETVEVNMMGTVTVLTWAAALERRPRRVLYISSGVYGYGVEAPPDAPPAPPVTEETPFDPRDATYDITKAAGEWLVARWSALTGIEAVSARPSAIFGPLDRDTEGRLQHPAPWHIARAALAEQPLSVNDTKAGYDWLYAPDAGRAMAMILNAARLSHSVYNIGFGRPASLEDLARGARSVCPDFELREGDDPDFVQRTDRRGGVWSVRDMARLEGEFDWRPTPLPQAMGTYLRWLQEGDHIQDLKR